MAFCTRCGRQIPAGSVCSCMGAQPPQQPPQQPQQPPQYPPQYAPYGQQPPQYPPQYPPQQPQYAQYPPQPGMPYYQPQYAPPSPFGLAMRNLPRLFGGYLKAPMKTSRLAAEKRDSISGWILMCVMFLLSFLSAMFLALRWVPRFGHFAVNWCVTGLVAPVCALILSFGTVYLVAAAAGRRIEGKSLVAVVGVNTILPMILVFLNTLMGLIDPVIFEIFSYLTIAAWLLSIVAVIREVFEVRLDGAAFYVLALCLVASFVVIALLYHWYVREGNLLGEIMINYL